MPNVTMAFDEQVQGWTSEFSFVPDSAISLNNNYYTFHNGEMWRHNNNNVARNSFYGINHDTVIEFVFNEAPTVVKNFKTLGYEGEGEWAADVETNIEQGSVSIYVLKEGKRYSWIEGKDAQKYSNVDFASNAVSGIGAATEVTGTTSSGTLTFESLPPFIYAN